MTKHMKQDSTVLLPGCAYHAGTTFTFPSHTLIGIPHGEVEMHVYMEQEGAAIRIDLMVRREDGSMIHTDYSRMGADAFVPPERRKDAPIP